jgi:type IX secretion system substrate protein
MSGKRILTLLLSLQCVFAFSQSIQRYAFTSSGSNMTGSSSIQSNIGELMADTYTGSGFMLSQGFVQNDQLSVNIDNAGFIQLNGNAFPNPVISELTVELNFSDHSDLIAEVSDVLGKKQQMSIRKTSYSGKCNIELDFQSMPPGVYFVRMYSAVNRFNQVFKITKV